MSYDPARCWRCHRPLRDPESQARGVGPVCAPKMTRTAWDALARARGEIQVQQLAMEDDMRDEDKKFQPSFPITVFRGPLTEEQERALEEEGQRIDPDVVNEWARAYRENDFGSLSPWAIFYDVTFIYDEQTADWVKRHCLAQKAVALIDYDDELKRWIFHSLLESGGRLVEKSIVERFESKPSQRQGVGQARTINFTEAQIEKLIFERLKAAGANPRRQVGCSAGVADIVTDDEIYEIKVRLSRDAFFRAIGQVLLYRDAIDPQLRAVVVGRLTKEARHLRAHAESLGVEVREWQDA